MVDVGDPHAPMTGYSPDHTKVDAGRRAHSGRWASPTGQVCHLAIFPILHISTCVPVFVGTETGA